MTFFQRLRNGVQTIDSEVKRLKELSESGSYKSDQQLAEDLRSAKRIDEDIRRTYVAVTQLHNQIRGSEPPLSESQQRIQSLIQTLFDIEDNSGLKSYGYKPFDGQYSQPNDGNVFSGHHNSGQLAANGLNSGSAESTLNSKQLFEEMCNKSEERTTREVRFEPMVANSAEEFKTIDCNENSDQLVVRKYDKLLSRTPQPFDFGITRRFTLLPQFNKYEEKSTPEEPVVESESTQTCRFNYFSNGLNFGSAQDSMTPPNMSAHSVNNGDSFVTVEFTPGLTTKRPKGISRVDGNRNKSKISQRIDNKPNVECFRGLPKSILQSVENDRKITPEQPIPSANSAKSAKILRSIAGKGSGTPPMPKTRVNEEFHKQLLKKFNH